MDLLNYEPWPALPFEAFKSTSHLLHMGVQAIGKFKLNTPFEPHWANVALWVTSSGLTTGLIPFQKGAFSIEMDLNKHVVSIHATWGASKQFALTSMSVASFTQQLFALLQDLKINIPINPMPQEIENPIAFDQDVQLQNYSPELANAWWHILVSTQRVMKRYHAQFDGETPPIGLMWGTFDIRDARYSGKPVPTTGENAGYIRRNAMNEEQVESGWWPGNNAYPRPAFYSFMYPAPAGIEQSKIKPTEAKWNAKLGEFILDYDDLRKSSNPDQTLFDFFQSSYAASAKLAGWKSSFITAGEPV